MDELVIALDGPSGVGKSSTAKLVAQKLRLAYLDTGAMYRAVACEFARRGLERTDETGIGELARTADLRMTTNPDAPRVCINGRDVTEEIRKPEISAVVSAVAVVPEVRRVLTERMRRIIAEHDRRMVVEGRDITTVVAPDAEVRVLLTADAAARIGRRDRDDSTVSNFTEAADGVSVVDSTHLGLDEVVAEILKLVPDA